MSVGTPHLRRIPAIGAVMLCGFLLLVGKLFCEQLLHGEAYRERIRRQSIRRIRIPALRGRIYTADLVPLADNRATPVLLLYPNELRRPGRAKTVAAILALADQLAAAVGRPHTLTAEAVIRHLIRRPGLPLELFEELTIPEAARALEEARNRRGVSLESASARWYPQGGLAAHLLGYTRRESEENASDREGYFYYIADEVGKTGLEQAFDRRPELGDGVPALRGEPGYRLVRVDHLGFVRKTLIGEIAPLNGNHVVLSIDSRAQRIAEAILGDRRGALVVVDADTGGVLAAASSPRYNLDEFVPRLSRKYYRALLDDPEKPLFHRAFLGAYSPGSIVKPLTALALLRAGVDPERKIFCDGYNQVGDRVIRCASYRSGGHGEVNLIEAIEKSCNSYFIQQGIALGVDPLTAMFRAAGFGRAAGAELVNAGGMLPDPQRKLRRGEGPWNQFDTALVAMGQGMLTVSPLQAAMYTAALANGGRLLRPQLVREIRDRHGDVVHAYGPVTEGELPVSASHLELVREGMRRVVAGGTGRRARTPAIELFGKTGSAELGNLANRTQDVWFIAFGRDRGRTYAAALVLEKGVSGGGDCAPLIAEFFTRFLTETETP